MSVHGGRYSYGVVETTLILIIIAMLFFTAWFVHRSYRVTSDTLSQTNQVAQRTVPANNAAKVSVTSFIACKQAPGSKILQTYPEQCVTGGGKVFTDTSEQTDHPAITKAAADSSTPAAGSCETANGGVVIVTLTEGTPDPRCSQVTASQNLSVVNPTTQTVTVTLGSQSIAIQAGKTGTIALPFGDYLQTGDHVMQTGLYGGSGPEIYLPAS